MSSDFDRISRAWRDAAADLGIRVTAPYTVLGAPGGPTAFFS